MDLKSGTPFWQVKNGLPALFPKLERDVRCDVAVIGAGITGALIADELARHGHAVCVVDHRDAGWGSTSASTALLQYEIDTHMVDLAKDYGEADAVLAYRACMDAIDIVAERAKPFRDVEFARQDSLYYASKRGHRDDLREEFDLRKKHRFPVQWFEPEAIESRFGFEAPAAILSTKAARVDPYRFAYRLLECLAKDGTPVHDRTVLREINADARGVQLITREGAEVRAKWLVVAGGYETQRFVPQRVAKNRSSYAFVTDPLPDDVLGVLRNTMVWESARPYLYLRTTGEGRLLVGGEDDDVDIPARRDAMVNKKAETLRKRVSELWPDLDIEPAFAWAGTFAETDDGLPFFGAHKKLSPRVLFAMAYGGNGITYSALGAGLLRAMVEKRKHALDPLFTFKRLER